MLQYSVLPFQEQCLMTSNVKTFALASFVALTGVASQADASCSGSPIPIPGYTAELEGALTVKAGTGCSFGVNGIAGAISEVKITQMPRAGRAGVENLRAYYIAKPGYKGPDEFTYVFIGTNEHGGPMRVSIKRQVTVVP
jgi:type 1 fimbria pilin